MALLSDRIDHVRRLGKDARWGVETVARVSYKLGFHRAVRLPGAAVLARDVPQGAGQPVDHLPLPRRERAGARRARPGRPAQPQGRGRRRGPALHVRGGRPHRRPDRGGAPRPRRRARLGGHGDAQEPRRVLRRGARPAARGRGPGHRLVAIDRAGARVPRGALRRGGRLLRRRRRRHDPRGRAPPPRHPAPQLRLGGRGDPRLHLAGGARRERELRSRRGERGRALGDVHLRHDRQAEGRDPQAAGRRAPGGAGVRGADADDRRRGAPHRLPRLPRDGDRLLQLHLPPRRHGGGARQLLPRRLPRHGGALPRHLHRDGADHDPPPGGAGGRGAPRAARPRSGPSSRAARRCPARWRSRRWMRSATRSTTSTAPPRRAWSRSPRRPTCAPRPAPSGARSPATRSASSTIRGGRSRRARWASSTRGTR